MNITYFTNGVISTKSMVEWFFGQKTVAKLTESALRQHERTSEKDFKFWQDGTGYLGIHIG